MSVIGSEILAGASGNQGYFLQRSLRFRSSASASLSRTPSSTGSQTTWTWSGWVKRGKLGATQVLQVAGSGTSNYLWIVFTGSDTLYVEQNPSSTIELNTTAVYRDPSAWYHVVVAVDTTQATSSNRIKLYVNGLQVTSLSTATYPSQNATTYFNTSGNINRIGNNYDNNSNYLDGYLTEVNFIDGQALTPSSFGETSAKTGVWQPKKYAGTYGTNGFYLPFSNNASTTTLGNDFSGNGNNWTTNNISLTAGSTYDSMTDVPTQAQISGNGNSNYCVVNPLNNTAGYLTVSGGNLNVSIGSYDKVAFGTMALPTTGKYYFEYLVTSAGAATAIGLGDNTTAQSSGSGFSGGNFKVVGSYSNNDLVGVAIDMDAGTGTIYKNNSSYNTLTGLTGTTWYPCSYINNASGSFNFGQRPFAYTPPTGFVALNTYNLPTPTIGATASTQAGKYFNPVLYTGNGGTQSITGVGFQPDFTWVKRRDTTGNNLLTDAVRGAGKIVSSNTTGAEVDDSAFFTSFNADGFSMAGGAGSFNASGGTYVGWNWKANGTGSSNTAGSITSTVSANTSAGFSVVTYTGTGSNATVGHGLGVAPKMIICKSRGSGQSWQVGNSNVGWNRVLYLNLTNAQSGTSASYWNNTAPTSTVFSLGTDSGGNDTTTMVAYCFAEVDGYSKFGSYTGNGSADGPFVHLGFRPKFVLVKRTDASTSWGIVDSKRNEFNLADDALFPNLSNAESSESTGIDMVSNGFKIRGTGNLWNASGSTYIYAAFAEVPTKFALAR